MAELCERMTYAELLEWMAFDEIRAYERDKAEKLAKKDMRSR